MKKFLGLILLLWGKTCLSQLVLVNTINQVYSINQANNLCTSVAIPSGCGSGNQVIFSIALHKDTLYFISGGGMLYRMKLGNPGSCTSLTSANSNSLTSDKSGMLYWTDPSAGLVKYDPYTNTKINLGLINATPAGDMIFYKDKLMLAAADGYIYEINLADPFHSTRYFSTGAVTFYGLVSVPSSCSTNKYYGLQFVGSQTVLHELDMENKLIVGPVCNLPFLSYDAASNVDNGSTVGIKIDSIMSKPVCGNNNVTDITIAVTNLSAGPLIFQLDGTIINSTGIFNSIPPGTHNIKITNTGACITDSTFIVTQSLSTQLNISVANPVYCDLAIGNITVKAPTNSMPLTYSLNGGPYTNNPVFNNLKVGRYTLSIMDGSQCRKDTVITLSCDPLACNGLNIPTGFTPDNNGKNDLFVPYPCKDITDYELRIYNRWGQLVFATTEKNKGWDGTRNKIPQPGGIYIWMINYSTLTDPTKKVLKGTVALIR